MKKWQMIWFSMSKDLGPKGLLGLQMADLPMALLNYSMCLQTDTIPTFYFWLRRYHSHVHKYIYTYIIYNIDMPTTTNIFFLSSIILSLQELHWNLYITYYSK